MKSLYSNWMQMFKKPPDKVPPASVEMKTFPTAVERAFQANKQILGRLIELLDHHQKPFDDEIATVRGKIRNIMDLTPLPPAEMALVVYEKLNRDIDELTKGILPYEQLKKDLQPYIYKYHQPLLANENLISLEQDYKVLSDHYNLLIAKLGSINEPTSPLFRC